MIIHFTKMHPKEYNIYQSPSTSSALVEDLTWWGLFFF